MRASSSASQSSGVKLPLDAMYETVALNGGSASSSVSTLMVTSISLLPSGVAVAVGVGPVADGVGPVAVGAVLAGVSEALGTGVAVAVGVSVGAKLWMGREPSHLKKKSS